jgi:AcrR family transcriptional regulator
MHKKLLNPREGNVTELKPGKKNSANETRMKLIMAGEQLIAEKGVEGVSLREVNTAAGQRNKSAAHYHFGTREGLIRAIYDNRMEGSNSRRLEMLEESDGSLRSLINALVLPQVEQIENEGAVHYARFLARVSVHCEANIRALQQSEHASGMRLIAEGLRKVLNDIPATIISLRIGVAMATCIHMLAERERLVEYTRDDRIVSYPLFVGNLVDVITAGLSAPVSEATEQELKLNNDNIKKGRKAQRE